MFIVLQAQEIYIFITYSLSIDGILCVETYIVLQ